MIRLLILVAALLALPCFAAPPALTVPDQPLSVPGAGLPVNFLLNFAVNFEDAGAAYREPYRATRRYAGYFNARLCYQYPMKQRNSVPTPDLDERTGYFSAAGPADARHECRAAFSGNFLNWATTSTLDLLRYALTGGDRVIDEPSLTVIQRARLPDESAHASFYAHPEHFPRKTIPLGADGSVPANVTPFGTDRLYLVSCRNRLLISNSGEGKGCDAPRFDPSGRRLTSDKFYGEFNVRVQVCTADDAALRPELCTRYRDGYKPQGVLQQAAHPVGVMTYLSDADGGALRAPLKLLSAQEEERGKPGGEWNPGTGVLTSNPDQASGNVSGAINVVNRLSAYSQGDPGAELYYEALRYLQGRPASSASGPALDDGLPVWRKAADPVVAACQRNIVATIGHAAFRQDRFVPGNTVTHRGDAARPADAFAPNGPLDIMQATRRVGDMEGAGTGLANLDTATDGSNGSYYLAGAGHWAHTNPIRPDRPVRVDSFSLQLGASSRPPESALYYAAKYGAFDDRNRDGNPNVTSGGEGDEWSVGTGQPRHFHPAETADEIIPAVRALFAGVSAGAGAIAGPTVVGGAGNGRYVIQTGYDAAGWSGSVQRRSVRVSPEGAVDIGATPAWDAGKILSGDAAGTLPSPSPAQRNIYTLLRQPDQPERTVPFRWGDLPEPVRLLFQVAKDGLGQARIDYLRGDRTMEAGSGEAAGTLRRRVGILGDVVRSVPLVVGPPASSGTGAGYGAFRQNSRGRPAAVYVGANDGMLHAFDAATGRELFAYVPDALLPALVQLTSPAYRHRPYVDGSPGQAEAVVRGRWRSVLASGMGMGARGVFALDVTDPAAFASGMGALWEFTERDDPAIGHVGAPPQIVKLNVAARDGIPQYRYFVLTTSGINPAGASGRGALFLLALDKPPEQKWQLGVNYYRFVTPVGDVKTANALSPPALAIAGDGSARYAYAGDLQGRLWRFDLGGKPPWGGTLERPLFVARDGEGRSQPIAHAPALVFAPGGGYLVMFATGRFIEQSDTAADSFAAQSFYAVHDSLKNDTVGGRSALEPRTVSGKGPYLIKGKPVNYTGEGARHGWYFDFPNTAADGERAAGSPVVQSGAVLFDTLLPALETCAAPSHRSYALDALSGLALGHEGSVKTDVPTGALVAADGTPTSVVFNAPLLMEIGTSTGARNATGGALATRSIALVRMRGAGKPAHTQTLRIAFAARRLSWREVSNWKDLHDKAKR